MPGPNASPSFQPPFDENIQATYGANGKAISIDRGYITQEKAFTGEVRRGLMFMFNPSDIQVGYPAYEGDIAMQTGIDPNAPGRFIGATNQKLTFSLLFDRSAELRKDGQHPGVTVDIDQLKAMTGMLKPQSVTSTRDNNGSPQTYTSQGATGVPIFVPMYFRFGYRVNALKFYGSIDSFDVVYTIWSATMVPMRAAVSFSVSLLIENSNFVDTTGGITNTTTGDPNNEGLPLPPGIKDPVPSPRPQASPTPGSYSNKINRIRDQLGG